MLNIDSEPMATPITNPRRAKKLRSTSGASAARLHDQQQDERGRRQYERADDGERRRSTCGSACSPKTSDTMNVASKTKPVQSVQPCAGHAFRGARGRRACGGQTGNGGRHEQDVEPEDHAPAGDVGERAAEQRPDAEAEHQKPGPGADRCSLALRRRAGVDRSQSAGHRETPPRGPARPVRPAAQFVRRPRQ